LRNSLFRFLQHHEIDPKKYNETITVFWLQMVARELAKFHASAAFFYSFNSKVSALANPKLPLEFYSEERLWSEEARRVFITPDLKQWKKTRAIAGWEGSSSSASLRSLRFSRIDHNTQETLLLDRSITLFRAYRRQLMEKRRGRRDAEDAESSQPAIVLNLKCGTEA